MKIPPSYSSCAAVLSAIALLAAPSFSQVPQLINYQGRVAVETVNFNGIGAFKFALVNAAGTTAYWTNDGTHPDGSEPTSAVTLSVTNGLYSVLLGDATLPNMQIVSAAVFANPDVHLRVWFSDGQNGFQLLTPDQRIAAVGYAIMAGTAQTVADGAITSAKIAPGAVDNTKLATSAITMNAGPGLAGGGTVALGGTISLANSGVTALAGESGITLSGSTGSITIGSNATSADTAGTLVLRDANGGFSAETITGNLLGNATTATTAGVAGTAINFLGPLGGDVSGAQGATLVNQVGGLPAASIAASAAIVAAATNLNTASTLIWRDADGNFSAGTITGNLLGSATSALTAGTAVSALSATDFTGTLGGDVSGAQGATIVGKIGGVAPAAANTAGAVVMRDVGGAFAAGEITATNFIGSGAGLTGLAGTFSWQPVSGITQQAVANTGYLATDAAAVTITLPATANAGDIVRVSGVGAGGWVIVPNIGQTLIGFGSGLGLSGSEGTTGAVQFVGNSTWQPLNESRLTAGAVQAVHIATGAVGNAQLADATMTVNPGPGLTGGGTVALGGTISLANSGVTALAGESGITLSGSTGSVMIGSNATSADTAGTLVLRDANGGFSAETITGNLLGNATTATAAGVAGTAINFLGPLGGDVSGAQGATIVGKIGGVAPAAANTAGAVVMRDAGGAFAAGEITATNFIGSGAGLTGLAGTFSWQTVTGIAQQAVANTGYLANAAAAVTITLPATANAGDIVRVSGVGAGGWAIVPNTGQSVAGFGAGLGPSGSQGATGAVQYVGTGTWQPMNESQLAPGSVGSAQLAPNIAVSGTLTAANFVGNGQGLTALSAASLSSGTLSDTVLSANVPRIDAATNTFTGILKSTGTFDATNATVLGFDKISRSAANTWTGTQTFASLTIAAESPNILFQNTTSAGSCGLGLSTDVLDPGHDHFIMGPNMRAVPTGYAPIIPSESAWGLHLERDFFNGETFQHEAYFTDGSSVRPFLFGYSQSATANVVSIVNGEVTISGAEVNDYLIPGLRFQFTNLTGAANVSANTFYQVHAVLSPTKFTFRPRYSGAPINATASGGTMKRGGWGSAGFTVPMNVITDNYDSGDTTDGTAFQVANIRPGSATLVRIDNYVGTQSVLQIDQKWRLGTDLDGTNAGNFFLMNLNDGLNDSVIQVDSVSRVAIGFKRSEDGYTPHTNTGTLDVNGVIVAKRPALPATVVEGGFIVVGGTAYIGSGGIWRALSFAP